jgi:hypothetical protein
MGIMDRSIPESLRGPTEVEEEVVDDVVVLGELVEVEDAKCPARTAPVRFSQLLLNT